MPGGRAVQYEGGQWRILFATGSVVDINPCTGELSVDAAASVGAPAFEAAAVAQAVDFAAVGGYRVLGSEALLLLVTKSEVTARLPGFPEHDVHTVVGSQWLRIPLIDPVAFLQPRIGTPLRVVAGEDGNGGGGASDDDGGNGGGAAPSPTPSPPPPPPPQPPSQAGASQQSPQGRRKGLKGFGKKREEGGGVGGGGGGGGGAGGGGDEGKPHGRHSHIKANMSSAALLASFSLEGLFFWCDTLDLTQHYLSGPEGACGDPASATPDAPLVQKRVPSRPELWRLGNREFVWNERLTLPFERIGMRGCCVMLLRGLCQSTVWRQDTSTTLLTRQRNLNPGSRYEARGLHDALSGVGNEYESEVIVAERTGPSSFRWAGLAVSRGTVPVKWSQKLKKTEVKPSLHIARRPYVGVAQYWKGVWARYGTTNFLCVNLLRNEADAGPPGAAAAAAAAADGGGGGAGGGGGSGGGGFAGGTPPHVVDPQKQAFIQASEGRMEWGAPPLQLSPSAAQAGGDAASPAAAAAAPAGSGVPASRPLQALAGYYKRLLPAQQASPEVTPATHAGVGDAAASPGEGGATAAVAAPSLSAPAVPLAPLPLPAPTTPTSQQSAGTPPCRAEIYAGVHAGCGLLYEEVAESDRVLGIDVDESTAMAAAAVCDDADADADAAVGGSGSGGGSAAVDGQQRLLAECDAELLSDGDSDAEGGGGSNSAAAAGAAAAASSGATPSTPAAAPVAPLSPSQSPFHVKELNQGGVTFKGEPLLSYTYEASLHALDRRLERAGAPKATSPVASAAAAAAAPSSSLPGGEDAAGGVGGSADPLYHGTHIRHLDWHSTVKKVGEKKTVEALWRQLLPYVSAFGFNMGTIEMGGASEAGSADQQPAREHEPRDAVYTKDRRQSGVLRVNCADSLDRTNLALFYCLLPVLHAALRAFYAGSAAVLPGEFEVMSYGHDRALGAMPRAMVESLASLFVSNGDVCATIYCNSQAMHSGRLRGLAAEDDVKKKKKSNMEIALSRMYQNQFTDAKRTRGLCIFLGRQVDVAQLSSYWRLGAPEAARAVLFTKAPSPFYVTQLLKDTAATAYEPVAEGAPAGASTPALLSPLGPSAAARDVSSDGGSPPTTPSGVSTPLKAFPSSATFPSGEGLDKLGREEGPPLPVLMVVFATVLEAEQCVSQEPASRFLVADPKYFKYQQELALHFETRTKARAALNQVKKTLHSSRGDLVKNVATAKESCRDIGKKLRGLSIAMKNKMST